MSVRPLLNRPVRPYLCVIHFCIFSFYPVPLSIYMYTRSHVIIEPRHEISNNVVCATSKASDQPAHTRSLIRVFACRLTIL